MIYAKETPKNARAILGNDVYDSISAKTGIEGGLGHKLYEQWRALPKGDQGRLPIEAQSKAYYDAIRSKAGISVTNSVLFSPAQSATNSFRLKQDLIAAELANPLIESLSSTGKLPANYVTKAEAMKMGGSLVKH